jgi:hypothetical protein
MIIIIIIIGGGGMIERRGARAFAGVKLRMMAEKFVDGRHWSTDQAVDDQTSQAGCPVGIFVGSEAVFELGGGSG